MKQSWRAEEEHLALRLRLVSYFSQDLDRIAGFYTGVMGFSEIMELRSTLYRGLQTPVGDVIGFHGMEVLNILNISDRTLGLGGMVTYEVDTAEEVDRMAGQVSASGGALIKQAAMTFYGVYQAVLADPDANVLRINHYPEGKAHYRSLSDSEAVALGLQGNQRQV